MREKISSSKKKGGDEEIDSNKSDDEDALLKIDSDGEGNAKKLRKGGAITDEVGADPFFTGQDENETAEEKRLRMTQQLIKKLDEDNKNHDKDDFFMNLHANTTMDVNIITDEDDQLKRALKYKILEQREKLFYSVAQEYGSADAEYDR